MKTTIDFSKRIGRIKPLHGVNNGPVNYGTLLTVSHYYKELGIPHVRLHDMNWPHPREVDIDQIFHDFNADPENPESYDFRKTDAYIKSVLDTGAQIVYRLGTSIEHTDEQYYTSPPQDFNKWASICIGIIKHYNDGWSNGFYYGIKYWEIWNEPDNPIKGCMWSGTDEQYFNMYKATSRLIKKTYPELKVGGYGATLAGGEFMENFLSFCRVEKLPLDFLSWHTYTNSPVDILNNALKVGDLTNTYGFANAESHLNEWNYFPGDWGKAFDRNGGEYYKEEMFERLKGVEGASFSAAVLLLMQDLPVDVANYYDGQPSSWFCGLFNCYGVPQKTYYAFKAFKILYDYGTRVEATSEGENEGIYCCAAVREEDGASCVLMVNSGMKDYECSMVLKGLMQKNEYSVVCYSIDTEHNLEVVSSEEYETDHNNSLRFTIGRSSIVLVRIEVEGSLPAL